MKQIILKSGQTPAAPRVTEDSFYPNIDTTYTEVPYVGQRLIVRTGQSCGIKTLSSTRAANKQGMAIYGNMMVTVAADNGQSLIYTIGTGGALTQVATFTLNLAHANAAQFAPIVEAGQTYPYLYVAGNTDKKCYVISIAADYTATIVQVITTPSDVYQTIIGDDGYIWGSGGMANSNSRVFTRFRKVAVSEGDLTLTNEDILDRFVTDKSYDSSIYTAQGWSVKFGKVWFCYGAGGAGKKRGVDVYDTATHRRLAELDFSAYDTKEYEDIDFWNSSMLIAAYDGTMYMVRF